ncbi:MULTISPECIES: hypothetical protein [unclassified Coleofasciculus]|uniref:hypothetical protein n=1 Tax=unclassified Coleofasciculus TaxID=2692782 RepID=UPI001D13B64D|nr:MULTISPECIES: hypothetical protein [unclassified Coleofasciculus]
MALEQHIKRYLAYWFQLGKKIWINNGQTALLPKRIIADGRYSPEFESLWHQILSPESGDCYLEGNPQTIAELLTAKWDIEPCARCDMPVPLVNVGIPPESCACSDLPNWPNLDLPAPREPVNTQERLSAIRDRLYHREDHEEQPEDKPTAQQEEIPPQRESLDRQEYLRLVRDRSYETTQLPEPRAGLPTSEPEELPTSLHSASE